MCSESGYKGSSQTAPDSPARFNGSERDFGLVTSLLGPVVDPVLVDAVRVTRARHVESGSVKSLARGSEWRARWSHQTILQHGSQVAKARNQRVAERAMCRRMRVFRL